MLNDREIECLLRAGHQVDLAEAEVLRDEPAVAGRIGGRRWDRLVMWGSIAAMVTVGVVVWLVAGRGSGATPGKIELVAAPGPGEVVVAPSPPSAVESHGTVVMAIVEDDAGGLRCVRWSPGVLGQRKLNEIRPDELRALGMTMVCAESPRRVLVVGMEGPRREVVPTSDAHATDMARCILSSPACGSGVFDAGRCAQAGCVGSDVSVRVESVAMK